jgi:hypothetical protein
VLERLYLSPYVLSERSICSMSDLFWRTYSVSCSHSQSSGADDDEILPSTTLDAQRDTVFHHFLDRLPQVAEELVNRYLSHGWKCT